MAAIESIFPNIFMAIRERLLSIPKKTFYVDQDLGQLSNTTRPPVTWPCLLIDFEEFEFENLSENVQTANGTVLLQLGFAPYSNSTQVTPDKVVEQAISYYELEIMIHRLLEGWSPADMCGSMIRTSVCTQKRNDRFRVRELRYSLAFEDYSTKTQHNSTSGFTLEISEEIDL